MGHVRTRVVCSSKLNYPYAVYFLYTLSLFHFFGLYPLYYQPPCLLLTSSFSSCSSLISSYPFPSSPHPFLHFVQFPPYSFANIHSVSSSFFLRLFFASSHPTLSTSSFFVFFSSSAFALLFSSRFYLLFLLVL